MYQTHGSSDTAAASLDKAAKIIEQHNAAQALELFKRAADIAMVRQNLHLFSKTFNSN